MQKEKLEVQRDSKLRELFGAVIKMVKPRYEVVDSRPMAPPVGFKRTPSLAEQIRDMVRSERLAAEVEAAGMETFDQADDFYIEDDPPDPTSPYEANFDVPVVELRRRQQEELDALKAGAAPELNDSEVPAKSKRQDRSKTREDAAAAPPGEQMPADDK